MRSVMAKKYRSIMDAGEECYLCGSESNLQIHHCLHGTANRKLADEDGLVVKLCPNCHRALHDKGVSDKDLQKTAQRVWMHYNKKSVEDFIQRFGKSYLDGE
jgi:Zn-finger protein